MIKHLRIGKVISIFGIKGEIKVFPTTDDIKRFDDLKNFYLSDSDNAITLDEDVVYKVSSVKYVKNAVVLKIDGFDSIEDSTKFIGKHIYVKREDAVKLKKNEFYIMDVIGLKAYKNGKLLGEIKDIMKTKAGDILVIDYDKKELLVPAVDEFIEKIDIDDSKVILKSIEGLMSED